MGKKSQTEETLLNGRQWLAALAIVVPVVLLTPWAWERIERYDTGPDYRIPYDLSNDYWLYSRWLKQAADPNQIVVLGDSVMWGEYVLPNGTLSHFLNQESGAADRYINAGVNGFFPLALEGLITYYGQSLRHRKVLLQCNVLWMTSPKADLSTEKEEPFNHSPLVPQFRPRIPCYKADANQRLSAVVERRVGFLGWVNHLQNACFGQRGIVQWTLADDGATPPRYPNLWKNPLRQITLVVPSAPQNDPQRGPASPRHRPWSENGRGSTQFEWVGLDSSLQWQALQRVIATMRSRGNSVMVVLGPFNEHMMAEDNRPAYRKIRDGIAAWLAENRIPHIAPETLPSTLYADASHPLTEGYALLARQISADATFQNWLTAAMEP